jgi:hypothetical protein
MRRMVTLQEYDFDILYVLGKINFFADELSRINQSPSTEIYTGSEEDEESDVLALNVVAVGMTMVSKSMVSALLRAYKADKAFERNSRIRK